MDAGRRDFEEVLEVGLRRRHPMDLRVRVDEGQILALQVRGEPDGPDDRRAALSSPYFGLPRFCNMTPSAAIRAVYSFGRQRPSFRSTSGISRSDMRDGPVRLGAFFMVLDPRELDVHAQEATRVWRKLEAEDGSNLEHMAVGYLALCASCANI